MKQCVRELLDRVPFSMEAAHLILQLRDRDGYRVMRGIADGTVRLSPSVFSGRSMLSRRVDYETDSGILVRRLMRIDYWPPRWVYE